MAGFGISNRDLAIFRELGIVSQLRGVDGAGIFQIKSGAFNNYKQSDMYKTWDNFLGLIEEVEQKKSNRILNSTFVDVVLGHVRAATKGVISDGNAHPFQFEHIVGAHNGTLKDKKYTEHPVKTDSELMFRDMNTRGITQVLTELDRDSAFAVSVYDHRDEHLYFARNELRPLAFAFLQSRGVMYWASDITMLKYVINRNGEEAKYFNLKPNKVIKVRPSNITKVANEKDPLTILKEHAILERQLPTHLQKIKDEEDRKKKLEEEKAQAAAGGTHEPKVESTNIVPFVPQEDKEPKKELGNSRSSTGQFLVTNLYKKCCCGGKTLNLHDQNLAMRGKTSKVKFDKVQNRFYCEKCEPEDQKKNGTQV